MSGIGGMDPPIIMRQPRAPKHSNTVLLGLAVTVLLLAASIPAAHAQPSKPELLSSQLNSKNTSAVQSSTSPLAEKHVGKTTGSMPVFGGKPRPGPQRGGHQSPKSPFGSPNRGMPYTVLGPHGTKIPKVDVTGKAKTPPMPFGKPHSSTLIQKPDGGKPFKPDHGMEHGGGHMDGHMGGFDGFSGGHTAAFDWSQNPSMAAGHTPDWHPADKPQQPMPMPGNEQHVPVGDKPQLPVPPMQFYTPGLVSNSSKLQVPFPAGFPAGHGMEHGGPKGGFNSRPAMLPNQLLIGPASSIPGALQQPFHGGKPSHDNKPQMPQTQHRPFPEHFPTPNGAQPYPFPAGKPMPMPMPNNGANPSAMPPLPLVKPNGVLPMPMPFRAGQQHGHTNLPDGGKPLPGSKMELHVPTHFPQGQMPGQHVQQVLTGSHALVVTDIPAAMPHQAGPDNIQAGQPTAALPGPGIVFGGLPAKAALFANMTALPVTGMPPVPSSVPTPTPKRTTKPQLPQAQGLPSPHPNGAMGISLQAGKPQVPVSANNASALTAPSAGKV